MLTTFWAVARALFVFITTMFLPIFCSKLSFKITLKLKENSTFFCSSATCPGDIFYPDFADGKPTYFDISVRNSLLPQFLSRVSFTAGIASSVGKMHRDAKYNYYSVSCSGCAFFPLVVKTLGIWTDSSISLLRRITVRTTLCSDVSQAQAFHNLLQQLSVKLWSYNAKMLLRHISLLPVAELDSLDQSLKRYPIPLASVSVAFCVVL